METLRRLGDNSFIGWEESFVLNSPDPEARRHFAMQDVLCEDSDVVSEDSDDEDEEEKTEEGEADDDDSEDSASSDTSDGEGDKGKNEQDVCAVKGQMFTVPLPEVERRMSKDSDDEQDVVSESERE